MNEPQNPPPPPTQGWRPSPPGPSDQPPATRAWQPSAPIPGPPPQFDPGPAPSFEPTTTITPTKRKRFGGPKARAAGLGLLAAVVLAVLLTGFWKPGFLRKAELDVHAAEDRVRQVLTDPTIGYGIADVSDVQCNDGKNPVIKANATFTCEATISGTKRTVNVTFADDKGSYWVGSPS